MPWPRFIRPRVARPRRWSNAGGNWLTDETLSVGGSRARQIDFCGENSTLLVLKQSNNTLNGKIPDEIGLLTSLTLIDLTSNQICGTVPSELGSLTALTCFGPWFQCFHRNCAIGTWFLDRIDVFDIPVCPIRFHRNCAIGTWVPLTASEHLAPGTSMPIRRNCALGSWFLDRVERSWTLIPILSQELCHRTWFLDCIIGMVVPLQVLVPSRNWGPDSVSICIEGAILKGAVPVSFAIVPLVTITVELQSRSPNAPVADWLTAVVLERRHRFCR
jgi:hypothetical protein